MPRAATKKKQSECCQNCRFWAIYNDVNAQPGAKAKGFCWRYPPRAQWSGETQIRTDPQPILYADQWCGEFSAKV